MDFKIDANRIAYKKQRNCYVSLIRKEKKTYFSNIKIYLTDNTTFWRKVKPLKPFGEK